LRRAKALFCQHLIDTNLAGILEGLARATQRYAAAMLAGDTSEFPEVVRFSAKKSGFG
jgi:phosphoribosylaminoimidazole (AIR) synthetase